MRGNSRVTGPRFSRSRARPEVGEFGGLTRVSDRGPRGPRRGVGLPAVTSVTGVDAAVARHSARKRKRSRRPPNVPAQRTPDPLSVPIVCCADRFVNGCARSSPGELHDDEHGGEHDAGEPQQSREERHADDATGLASVRTSHRAPRAACSRHSRALRRWRIEWCRWRARPPRTSEASAASHEWPAATRTRWRPPRVQCQGTQARRQRLEVARAPEGCSHVRPRTRPMHRRKDLPR